MSQKFYAIGPGSGSLYEFDTEATFRRFCRTAGVEEIPSAAEVEKRLGEADPKDWHDLGRMKPGGSARVLIPAKKQIAHENPHFEHWLGIPVGTA